MEVIVSAAKKTEECDAVSNREDKVNGSKSFFLFFKNSLLGFLIKLY